MLILLLVDLYKSMSNDSHNNGIKTVVDRDFKIIDLDIPKFANFNNNDEETLLQVNKKLRDIDPQYFVANYKAFFQVGRGKTSTEFDTKAPREAEIIVLSEDEISVRFPFKFSAVITIYEFTLKGMMVTILEKLKSMF